MPKVLDYRTRTFKIAYVDASGQHIGRSVYWKLYAIENLVRILIHSVLLGDIGQDWWGVATDRPLRRKVESIKEDYASQPSRTSPGKHEIYYVFLRDLNKIILANIDSFRPLIPDIDNWLVRLEAIRLPRNVVGHMNWLNIQDKNDIDETYLEVKALMRKFAGNSGSLITIP